MKLIVAEYKEELRSILLWRLMALHARYEGNQSLEWKLWRTMRNADEKAVKFLPVHINIAWSSHQYTLLFASCPDGNVVTSPAIVVEGNLMQWPGPNPRIVQVDEHDCPVYIFFTTSGKTNEFCYYDWLEKGVLPDMVPDGPPDANSDMTMQGYYGLFMHDLWKAHMSPRVKALFEKWGVTPKSIISSTKVGQPQDDIINAAVGMKIDSHIETWVEERRLQTNPPPFSKQMLLEKHLVTTSHLVVLFVCHEHLCIAYYILF